MRPSVDAKGRFVVKATWGSVRSGGAAADLDLQAIAFFDDGRVADAVYWDRPRSRDASIVHTSGDQGGHGGGVLAEEVVVDLAAVAPNIAAIAFTLSSFKTDIALDAVTDVSITTEHQTSGAGADAARADAYFHTAFPEFGAGVVVGCVGALVRMGKHAFDVAEIELGFAAAANFVDAVPSVREELRLPVPPPPEAEFSLPLRLNKGESAVVASGRASGVVVAGCSWDLEGRAGEGVDVDLAAVLLDRAGRVHHRVHWGQLEACDAVWHSGDKTAGEGVLGEDKEQIRLDLRRLPFDVYSVCFVVNSYDSDVGSLAAIGDVYFRLFAEGSREDLVRVDGVGSGRGHNGIALAVLARTEDDFRAPWRLYATSEPVDGETLLSPAVSGRISEIVGATLRGGGTGQRDVRAALRQAPAQPGARHAAHPRQSVPEPPVKPQRPTAQQQQVQQPQKASIWTAFVVAVAAAIVLRLIFGA
eukprot:CAMPEP_0174832762 /NCGR_PEP_ID=MMETSP1114-20130205/3843_1 /TAXON_ID=312471 /ORGANISM="Neobodo designis, Strain CCAP 1951/1" /LENGTH=473 /DNA_ID=CAMNT_0016066627 /DNA_START=62 /DNA_END=1483 /DNA_ORIENTATION=-